MTDSNDRMNRIKRSLEKINQIMKDTRKMKHIKSIDGNVVSVSFPDNFKPTFSEAKKMDLDAIASKLEELIKERWDYESLEDVSDWQFEYLDEQIDLKLDKPLKLISELYHEVERHYNAEWCEDNYNRLLALSEDEQIELLRSCIKYELGDYRLVSNEIASIGLSYKDVSICDYDIPEYFALSDREQDYVKGKLDFRPDGECDYYIDFQIECTYDRLVATLDLGDVFDILESRAVTRSQCTQFRKQLKQLRLKRKAI